MTQVPASSHGLSTAGGTLTGPLTIDLSDNPTNQRGLHVIFPSTFDFSVEAFTFEIESQFGLFAFTTSGRVSTKGNPFQTAGGFIATQNGLIDTGTGSITERGTLSAQTPGNLGVLNAVGDGTLSFFDTLPVAQPAAIANAAGGVVIDAEARAALNALLAAARALGLTAT